MIPNNLKHIRTDQGLTQAEIADILNIKQPVYHQYESGKRKLPHDIILQLKCHFDISIDWMYTGEGKMYVSKSESEADPDVELAIKIYNRLNKEFGEWDESITEEFINAVRFINKISRMSD